MHEVALINGGGDMDTAPKEGIKMSEVSVEGSSPFTSSPCCFEMKGERGAKHPVTEQLKQCPKYMSRRSEEGLMMTLQWSHARIIGGYSLPFFLTNFHFNRLRRQPTVCYGSRRGTIGLI